MEADETEGDTEEHQKKKKLFEKKDKKDKKDEQIEDLTDRLHVRWLSLITSERELKKKIPDV